MVRSIQDMGSYTFTTDLGSGLSDYSGTIGVLADDTTSVSQEWQRHL